MVGGEEGEEEVQLIWGTADSSSSLAAIITHVIYAVSEEPRKKKQVWASKKQQQQKFCMLNCAVLLLILKIDSHKTIEAKEKYLKEWWQSSPTLVFTVLDKNRHGCPEDT